MFIEKISKKEKINYIKNYVYKLNCSINPYYKNIAFKGQTDKFKKIYKNTGFSYLDTQKLKEFNLDKVFKTYENDEIYVKFYNVLKDNKIEHHAFIFKFNETSVKIENIVVASVFDPVAIVSNTKKYIEKNYKKLTAKTTKIDKKYVLDFVAPNTEDVSLLTKYITVVYEKKLERLHRKYLNSHSPFLDEINK